MSDKSEVTVHLIKPLVWNAGSSEKEVVALGPFHKYLIHNNSHLMIINSEKNETEDTQDGSLEELKIIANKHHQDTLNNYLRSYNLMESRDG